MLGSELAPALVFSGSRDVESSFSWGVLVPGVSVGVGNVSRGARS